MDALVQLAETRRRPLPVDVALAAGLLVWALLEAAFVAGPGPDWARYVAALAFSVPFLWRRRWPVAVLLIPVAAVILRAATTSGAESGAMPFPALLLGAFSVALYARPAALAIAAAPLPIVGFASAAALGYFEGDPTPVDIAILSFISLGAWSGGWVVRRRAAALARAEAAAPALARDAVAAERARMARELHDIVAHSVSIIAVQAGAAEAVLDADDRERAREHVQAVRRTAHEALVELRRLLGVLREEDPEYRPQPGLDRLGELLEDARRAGLDVELQQDGPSQQRIPAGVDLAAYRIVQEGLTNARRHAGAVRAVVRVRQDGGRLELEVVNEPSAGRIGTHPGGIGEGSGRGLAGMRERARLSGGTLEAGPIGDGGFRVHASLPLEEPAA